MAIDFECEMNKFPDNVSEATTAAALESWLDGLSITTLYSLYIEHIHGFYIAIVTYA
jgi:hypothetical protein